MALKQFLGPANTLLDSKGNLLKNGLVYLYQPGTTTKITTYSDSGLVNANTNPVVLNGGGKATVWLNGDADVRIEDKDGNLIDTAESINPDDLSTGTDSGLILNGSFEIDTNSDGTPDSWTQSDESGSSNAIDATTQTDGLNSFRFTSTGVGGGSLVTDDFFPVNDVDNLVVQFDLKSSVAGVHNIVNVDWYDSAKAALSTSAAYDSTANPTSFASQSVEVTPPATARFAKLEIIGIDPDTPISGNTWYDKVKVFYPQVLSGVFDNITIQNNEIISTNTNGDINLIPNGTGNIELNTSGGGVVNYSGNEIAKDADVATNAANIATNAADIAGKASLTASQSLSGDNNFTGALSQKGKKFLCRGTYAVGVGLGSNVNVTSAVKLGDVLLVTSSVTLPPGSYGIANVRKQASPWTPYAAAVRWVSSSTFAIHAVDSSGTAVDVSNQVASWEFFE